MRFILLIILISFYSNGNALPNHSEEYPFKQSVNELIKISNDTQNLVYFGRASGRCAAMFRSMHILLHREDPKTPHPTLENYYKSLIDVYRDITTNTDVDPKDSSNELSDKSVQLSVLYLNTYTYWLNWNKQLYGDYIEDSPLLKRELNECKAVLEITGII